MQLNPQFSDVVKCNSDKMNEEVRLSPDETYETVFPFKISRKFVDKVLSSQIESAHYNEQITTF
jgi:hypothetical protein